ncbi:hypothetical protein [Geothrix oryzisoli]|uniref:hypothetical protein n=1 Tax=Geothrix oryzisoli TaxID=2922721 RepID=UPI001FADBDAA|nr:hypothetical protein [Geothrix oryzisoli]
MADDKEVAVKLSADVKSLLQGMKDAQEHTETAVSGMKGDLGSAIESFEKFGASAIAIGVVGLAFEALKESASFIKDSINETNELARTYKDLAYQTGESFESLNRLNTAQSLTGGSAQELEGWMKGATKSIRSNSEFLVANGIAANNAALMAMPFVDYLKAVMQKAETLESPMERGVFLQKALGRAGQEAAPQIREMLEQLKDAPEVLARYGRAIGEDNVVQMERAEKASGKVTVSWRGLKQTMSETFGDNLVEFNENWAHFLGTWAMGVNELHGGDGPNTIMLRQIEQIKADIAKGNAEIRAMGAAPVAHLPGGEGGHENPKKGGHLIDPEAQKKAAEELRAMRKAVDEDIIRSAAHVVAEQMKDDKELVASGQMTYAELVGDMKDAYKVQLDTAMKALKDEEKLAAGKPAELQAVLNKEKELNQKYYADLRELDRQAAENTRKERAQADADAEKARKQNLELARIAAGDELNLLKFSIEEQEQALDQQLIAGRINEAQWVAMRKAGITQELRAQLDALDQEQKAAEGDLVHWKKIQAQKDALNRKAYADLAKLDTDLVAKSRARWDGFFRSMTGGFNNSIQGLINGTITWGQAFQNVTAQALNGIISFFVQWGEEEAIKWATSMAMGETGRVAEATGAAAVYAVNAMGSVAAIPFYGWAMAPAVGAEAYGAGLAMAGLASAEGGWDRVPADQVAQIHKNEMILPAHIAEPVRQMAERGGGGSVVHHHWNVLDGQDVKRVLSRHQDVLFGVIREGGKNRRI